MASRTGTLTDLEARLTAISEVRPTPDFEPLRPASSESNILKQADFDAGQLLFNATLLEDGPGTGPVRCFRRAKMERR